MTASLKTWPDQRPEECTSAAYASSCPGSASWQCPGFSDCAWDPRAPGSQGYQGPRLRPEISDLDQIPEAARGSMHCLRLRACATEERSCDKRMLLDCLLSVCPFSHLLDSSQCFRMEMEGYYTSISYNCKKFYNWTGGASMPDGQPYVSHR